MTPCKTSFYNSIDKIPTTLTVEELAKILRVGRSTAYEFVHSGIIPSVRIGRQIRIYRDHVFAFLEQHSQDGLEITEDMDRNNALYEDC